MLRRRADRARDALERQLVWIMGTPRAGTTWLLNLLGHHPSVVPLDEPLIGAHLGVPATVTVGTVAQRPDGDGSGRALDVFADRADYFFARAYEDAWAPPLRELLLARFAAQVDHAGAGPRDRVVLVKEPHGSEAADVIVRLLPRCRLLVVTRDGRDVVDSIADALQPGGWASSLATVAADGDTRLRFIDDYARLWSQRTRIVLAARAALPAEQSMLLRYEDLIADTGGCVRRVFSWLGLPESSDLDAHVDRLSFSQVPTAQRGTGKFHRAATPGLWRENLTADEQRVATDAMRPMLDALGYD